jgi:hypothetical protein
MNEEQLREHKRVIRARSRANESAMKKVWVRLKNSAYQRKKNSLLVVLINFLGKRDTGLVAWAYATAMCDIGAGRLESRRCSFVHASLD